MTFAGESRRGTRILFAEGSEHRSMLFQNGMVNQLFDKLAGKDAVKVFRNV